MSESEKLEERLRLLENDLRLQKSRLVEKLARKHVQKAPKTAPKRTANALKHDPDFAIKVRALTQAAKLKKRLYKHIYANQVKFPYKNRIRINNLEFVSTNKGATLALVSSKFLDSNKQLTSLDDLKTTLTYNGHRYIKTLDGDYIMQNPQYSDEKQFCLYYTRSGTCSNKNCPFVHSPTHVALCPNVIQNKDRICKKPNCQFSHTPSQYNAPSCKFFQSRNCTNENCVFSHKSENKDARICREFAVNGYCDKGRACELAHYFECPDLQELGFCPRGSSCKLAHKTKVQPMNHKAIRNIDNDNVTQKDHPLLAAIQESSSEESDIEQTQTSDLDMNHDYVQIA
ncbi:hypothetical protein KL905_002179 [Ogataea polymorpha]|uniref:C3H1-type domain-containing protein n=1 Tax=Ogataea polymorpha TaxID=460523 RepID=A0A9P8PR25_9ASCO|nr:hypothetical protein KL937_001802 [Ogataea polymorpha]KAG7922157.1 hypothetical protein KL905_002179 [Ogataea polymorpha]KAG7926815.1 hypothetical protein KL925_003100 [Ogataea polymorpha]KAG7936752.1 hypothetical protein KL904_002320 [Ogataea polymorpha]KAH3676748.1 hypothetical protein OGATHE_001238 [Ogataea polymorpha]